MFGIILGLCLGTLLGLAAGLLPGIHPNSLIPILLGMSFFLDPFSIAVALVTTGIVNSFVNFIPSILFGAPEDASALSVLPGHRLLLQGRGYEAIKLTVVGGLGSVLFVMASLPLFVMFVPQIYSLIRPKIHLLLILVVSYMIITEKGKGKVFALAVFLLSGMLGKVVLDSGDYLFPLLSGLFGMPLLLLSIKNKTSVPEITFEEDKIKRRSVFSGVFTGTMAGIIAGLLPGLGSAQSTILAQEAMGREKNMELGTRKFLISVSGVNVADMIYSIFALWLIGNPRSGIATAVGKLVEVGANEVIIFTAVIAVAAFIGAFLTLTISKKALNFLKKMDYGKACIGVFAFILALVFLLSGAFGLLISFIALGIGLIPNIVGVRRGHCMGCLILPTIIYFAAI